MKFCAAHTSSVNKTDRNGKQIPLSGTDLSFSLFTDIDSVPAAYWDLAQNSGNYFLQKEFLQLLEDQPPGLRAYCYLLFYHRKQAIGIAYGQLLEFRANEHIRQSGTAPAHWQQLLASQLRLQVLICGNMLLTGQHGFYFLPAHTACAGKPLQEALRQTADYCRGRGLTVNAILLKDLDEREAVLIGEWQSSDFHQLEFQPNMLLAIPKHWHSMADYLDDLSSKYRVRFRRARKKLKGIRRIELNEEQIRAYEPEIYRLYRKVAENSDFCVGYLSESYFSEFKARSPKGFRLWGYFKEDRLIGFCTTVSNGHTLEAHFLGLDDDQQTYQLYLNMLYHLIEVAIDVRAGQLVFSRTALEIKSSVGAVSIPTSVFLLHHSSTLVNRLVPRLVNWLEPREDWQPRHPFREPSAERLKGIN